MPRSIRSFLFLSLVILSIFATGCATMVNGRSQTLDVDSYPSRATVRVDCGDSEQVIETPAKIEVSRAADHCFMTFSRDGYESKEIALTHQVSRAARWNGAFGVPSALVLGIAGAIAGSVVDGADTGFDIGVDAGYVLGTEGATALDKKGGAWKWVPGRIFVVLTRPE